MEGTLAFRNSVDELLPHLFLQASVRRFSAKLKTRKLTCFQNIAQIIHNDCRVRIYMFFNYKLEKREITLTSSIVLVMLLKKGWKSCSMLNLLVMLGA